MRSCSAVLQKRRSPKNCLKPSTRAVGQTDQGSEEAVAGGGSQYRRRSLPGLGVLCACRRSGTPLFDMLPKHGVIDERERIDLRVSMLVGSDCRFA